MDWADRLAEQIVDMPGILQVWDKAGYCKKSCRNCQPCNQPLAASAIDLTLLKKTIANTLREVKEAYR